MRLGQLPERATLVSIAGKPRFVVPVINAAATDVIGLLLSGLLFFAADNLILKVLAVGGGVWMGSALLRKLSQLNLGPVGTLALPGASAISYTPEWRTPAVADFSCSSNL